MRNPQCCVQGAVHTVLCGTWDFDLPSGGKWCQPALQGSRYRNGKKKEFSAFTAISVGRLGRMCTEPKKEDCSREVSGQIIKTWKNTQKHVTGLHLILHDSSMRQCLLSLASCR